MRQPLGDVVWVAADNKPCHAQLLKGCARRRHLRTTGTLAIVKRAICLQPRHRGWHLHWATEGGQTSHVHHCLSTLSDGLLGGLRHVDVARTDAMLRARHPAKALLGNFLIVLEGVLEHRRRVPNPGDGNPSRCSQLDGLRRPCWHPDWERVLQRAGPY